MPTTKVQVKDEKYSRISIPTEIIKAFDLKEGEVLEWLVIGKDSIVLRRLK